MTAQHAALVPLSAVDDDFRCQWQQLADESLAPNAFFEPAMTFAAASLPEAPPIELLIVRRDGRLVLLAPVHRVRSYRRLPVAAVKTWKHDYSSLGTPLLSPDEPAEVLETAIRFLAHEKLGTLLVIESFGSDGPVAAALRTAMDRIGIRPSSLLTHRREAVLTRRSPNESQHGLSASTVKNYRKSQRRLDKELGGRLSLVDVADSDDLGSAVEDFLRAEASGWKARDGGAFACREGHADFFRTLCRQLAAEGRLQFYVYGTPETPVAFMCNLIAQDRVFCFKVAFDDDYGRFSPGSTAELEELLTFHRQTEFESMDSCRESKYARKHTLFPDSIEITTMLIPLESVRGRVAARSVPMSNAVGRKLREWREALRKKVGWKKPR